MASDATYDVFLSHANRDKPAVEELARRLKAAGIEPFLDKWHLVPGEPWQEALEAALERSRICAVFLGPGHLGPWQNEEMRDALDTLVQDKSRRVVPVLLPGAVMPEKKALPPFLRRLTWVEFGVDLNDPQAFHRLICGIKGIPPGDGPAPAEPKPPIGPVLTAPAGDEPGPLARTEATVPVTSEPTRLARTEPPSLMGTALLSTTRVPEVDKRKRPSRRLLLLLATVTLAVIIGALGLFLIPPTTPPPKPVTTAPAPKPAVCPHKEETNESGIVFVRICPGTFTMGSTDTDWQAYPDEKPAHQVTLSEFWLGKTEVTNKQYRRFQPTHQGAADLPATGVSWDEAKAACERFGGRLPTEAEWEYAARAGSQTVWSFGDDGTRLDDYAWYEKNSGYTAHSVGTRKPNDWGLYDMYGNVLEWVADRFGTYTGAPQTNPGGPAISEARVLRGGAFDGAPRFLRSAVRIVGAQPADRAWDVGFRCVRGLRRQP